MCALENISAETYAFIIIVCTFISMNCIIFRCLNVHRLCIRVSTCMINTHRYCECALSIFLHLYGIYHVSVSRSVVSDSL